MELKDLFNTKAKTAIMLLWIGVVIGIVIGYSLREMNVHTRSTTDFAVEMVGCYARSHSTWETGRFVEWMEDFQYFE